MRPRARSAPCGRIRLDVLIDPEDVVRVVRGLHRREAAVRRTIGGADPRLALEAELVYVRPSRGQMLRRLPNPLHPRDVPVSVAGRMPHRVDAERVPGVSMWEARRVRRNSAQGAAELVEENERE